MAAMAAAPFHALRPSPSACTAACSTPASSSGARFFAGVSVKPLRRVLVRVATSSLGGGVPGFEDHIHGMFTLEDDLFEDTFPAPALPEDDHGAEDEGVESSGLVPEEWRSIQRELSKTKKQKKREMLDSRDRKAKERQELERRSLQKQIAGREEYRDKFFPRVLPEDMPTEASDDDDGPLLSDSELTETTVTAPVKRATPKNPRSVLGNATFEDMSRMLSAGKLDERQAPTDISKKANDVESMEVSGSKLLTAEEKTLLKVNEINFTKITSRKWNPLQTFATSGQINQLELLLRRGSDINAEDMDGFTALHRAALCGGARDAILRYLLKTDASTTATDKDGATVLHGAARNANSFAIKAVLRHNADINAGDNEGWTPLHIAVQSGRTDIVNLLIARGAVTTIQNKDGNTPLDIALSFGKEFRYYEVVKLLKNGSKGTASQLSVDELVDQPRPVEISSEDNDVENQESYKLMTEEERDRFKSHKLNFSTITSKKWIPLHTFAASGQVKHLDLLLRHGINVNARDTDGLTELHWAAICGRDATVRYLLKSGADAKAVDKDGVSVLHYATRSGNTFAMKAVLRRNADVNACDNEGWTPLHIAVQSGRLDIIKLLLTRGADTTIQNKDGNTPLDVALSFGKGFLYYHVVKLLKKGTQRLTDEKQPDLVM